MYKESYLCVWIKSRQRVPLDSSTTSPPIPIIIAHPNIIPKTIPNSKEEIPMKKITNHPIKTLIIFYKNKYGKIFSYCFKIMERMFSLKELAY